MSKGDSKQSKASSPTSYAPPQKEEPRATTAPAKTDTKTNGTESHTTKGTPSDANPVDHISGSAEEKYELGKELGRGGFSVVREGLDKRTGEKVAIKFIEKKYVDQEELKLLQREIDIMKQVKHRNVLRLFEIYETDSHLSLVMELVNGGELFYKIVDKGSYTEKEAKGIVAQLVEGVNYLHGRGIAHRDLKPENLLCSETKDGMEIKIADFGLSKAFGGGDVLETSCGTPDYAAPEVLRMEGTYDKAVDCWSVGVITYVILCGFPPFYGKTQAQLFEKILNADFDFPDPEWTHISDEAKDFIKKLLVLNVDARATAEDCANHPWLKTDAGHGNTQAINVNKLRDYNTKRVGPT